MANISNSQKKVHQSIETPSTSFSEQFNVEYSQSFSKYKRLQLAIDSDSSEDDSSDSSSSTGDKGPEMVSTGQTKEWKLEVGELHRALEVAISMNARDEEIQLYREIGVFRNFIQFEYFEALELYPDTTVEFIRNEIIEAAKDASHLKCIGDIDSFLPSCPSSPLSTNLASVMGSSPPVKLKVLPRSERVAKAVTAVREGSSIRQAATIYRVNRKTVSNRISGKHGPSGQREDKLRLTLAEEVAFLHFVDQYVALGFPPKIAMLKEKAMLLLRERGVDEEIGVNWARRFLGRHPKYDAKFPRNLNQERHWNSDPMVISN